jgi:WD40 repeat protein
MEKKANDEKCTIFDAAVNDDGNLICVVGKKDKGWIFIKDVKNDKILLEKTFDEYGQFTIVKFSPDGKNIYVAEKIRFILCLDSNTGNILRTYEMPVYNTPANQKQNISAIAISPDGKIFAADTEPACTIWYWNIGMGEKIMEFRANDFTVSDIAFSPDSKFLATGCLVRPEIKIWKVPVQK